MRMEKTEKQEFQNISDKIDFKTKAIKKDKEGHYFMVKGSIQEEDITIIYIYICMHIYICPKYWTTQTHKTNINRYKRRN